MGSAAFQALAGLILGLLAGQWAGLGPMIGAVARQGIGIYETAAPVLIFAILGPSMLNLLRGGQGRPRHFTLYAVAWFSALRLLVLCAAAAAVIAVYRLPLNGSPAAAWRGQSIGTMAENRYLLAMLAAALTAWLLRHRDGAAVRAFMAIPDWIEASGNMLTRFTPLFGFLMGVYVVSIPGLLTAAGGSALHAVSFRWFDIGPNRPMAVYLTVTGITALLCLGLHTALVIRARLTLLGFSIQAYLSGYLLRVYPLIWSTGAESLAIPVNLATLRRYGGSVPDVLRDLTVGLASTLNLNGSLICALVLIPAVCMAIGHPLSAPELLACLPLIFILGYAIPGIPGELVVFADPIAQAIGVTGTQRDLFLLLFLSWQIGLTDSFRSAGSATDAVPATLLLTHAYKKRIAGTPASRAPDFRP
jgi:hypothetical protein